MSNASKFETNTPVYRQGKQVSSDFKLTVLGLTPSDWDVSTLEALSEKIMVGIASAATHAYRDRGVPFLRNQNILPNKLDVSDILYVSPEYEVSFQNKRLKAGDLLTARTGYPGTTCMIPDPFEGAQSFTTLITRLRTDRVLPEFVCAFMNSEQGQKFFELNQIGGGQKNVNSSILKTFPLPIPRLQEQTAIANALSDVDALIQELEKLIAKKQAIKTATMQQLLTGRTRLPAFAYHPDGRKKGYKPSELGEIPEDWEVVCLGDVVDRFIGGGTPSRSKGEYWGGEIPWVTVKDFATFSPVAAQESITRLGLNSSASNLIPRGTLITSTRMALGKAVIYDVDVAINQDLKALFCKPMLDTKFLYFWFENNQERIDELGSGSTVKGLSLVDLRSIEFILMRPNEQKAIANTLVDIDRELEALAGRLFKTRQIKQGMMQELLTGKTRLVPPTEPA